MSIIKNRKSITTGIVVGLGLAAIPALAIALGASSNAFATGISGDVQLNTEVSTSIAMKIASPNDTNPDCMTQSGITYGVANRYATSNGAEGSKQVDGFDGTTGGADELNTNTSCATLTMNPNAFSSTYSDVTVYTNSGNGYALSLRSADNTSPNLVNTTDSTQYIPAGALTEVDGTGTQAGQKVVPGGQNKWAYKTNNGITTSWTAATTTDSTIKSYDQETSGGDTTRVTYGISAGNNPTGKYATTLTYTATMFDGANPYVGNIDTEPVSNLSISPTSLKIARNQTKTLTVTPAEGYYLSDVDCPEGYNCSNYTTDKNDPASATTQAISVKNQSASSTAATIGLEVSKLAKPLSDLTYMQDMEPGTVAETAIGASKSLIDSRDNKSYTVKKLNDGKIWMVQDLKLDGGRTLTSADSDVSSNFSLLAENTNTWCTNETAACMNQSLMVKTDVPNGYLYNWYAATAGSGTYELTSGNAQVSICPKGWKLPTGNAGGDFSNLDIAYGGTGTNRTDNTQREKLMSAANNGPAFNWTGYRNGGTVYESTYSLYWSRTVYSERSTGASAIELSSGDYVSPLNNGYKYHGFAVRCVAAS